MTMTSSETLARQAGQIKAAAELFPAGFMLLRYKTYRILIEFRSGINPDVIQPPAITDAGNTEDDLLHYIPVADRDSFLDRIREKVQNVDVSEHFSMFQQISTNIDHELKWHLFSFKVLGKEPGSDETMLSATVTPISAEDKIMKKVLGILEENKLIKKHFSSYLTLTGRERQVLNLLAEGKSSKSIAENLYISLHTAETHCKKIKAKLGARTRMELMQIASLFAP